MLDVSDLVVCRDKDGKLWDDYDALIQENTLHASADDMGPSGRRRVESMALQLGTAKVLIVAI